MKIEKIAENKIRIILNKDDFEDTNIDLHSIMEKTAESQGLLLKLLNKAQKEVNFNTDGYKLLIEAFSSSDDIFVFTITKFLDSSNNLVSNKKLIAKRKTINLDSSQLLYRFINFEEFCSFCNLVNLNNFPRKLFSSSVLYLYNSNYFLIINNINIKNSNSKKFLLEILEFAKPVNHSANFEYKLKEHGKIIIKKNAVLTGIKYFSNT